MEYLDVYRKGFKLTQLASLLACMLISQLSAAQMPERFHTGQHGELITELRITGMKMGPPKVVQGYMPAVLYSVKIPGPLNKGTLLSIKAYGELTNPYKRANIMLGYNTIISTNGPDDVRGFDEISEAKGYNITPAMHHGTFTDVDDLVIEVDVQQDVYVNVVVWAASTGAPFDGRAKLKVEQDYGRLSVLVFKQNRDEK